MTSEETNGKFYLVTTRISGIPLSEHLEHGYEDKWDFLHAVQALASRWKGRIGECVGERHDFYLLRFHDTPGGKPDEEWIPKYILQPVDRSECAGAGAVSPSEEQRELDDAFSFD